MCCTPRETCGCFHQHHHHAPDRSFEHQPFLHRRYYSGEEVLKELNTYKEELEKELKGVREKISGLEKKK